MDQSEMTAAQAAHYLKVSRGKLWALLKSKQLSFREDPLDNRKKLIKVSDLNRLRTRSAHHR